MAYDYYNAVKRDALESISKLSIDMKQNKDVLFWDLYDNLWDDDNVTGGNSWSYTNNYELAKQYVLDNIELCDRAIGVFDDEDAYHTEFRNDYEYLDVITRMFILYRVVDKIIEEKVLN